MIRLTERFILEREIGSGGMSRVFLGRDEVLERQVAVKVLNPELGKSDIGARFRREGRTAAKLSHPNIVQVYDAGEGTFEGRETSYIVMEYISGGDLKDLIDERGDLTGGDLARLSGVAAGLTHAHERGVIHRDIKPQNILITGSGDVKVTDFGVARALDATYATKTGSYLGTALYSSPEQLRGDAVTPKSDVYSLGVTLYHAATGQTPFTGTPIEVASQHVSRDPTPPRRLNDAVDASLEALILSCLEKDPESRPAADDVRLGLLEAGRGVHATQVYAEAPATGVTAPREPAPSSPRREAPAAETTRSRPPVATTRSGRGRARGALLILALLAVLAVIAALALPTLRGGEGEGGGASQDEGGRNPSGGDQAGAEEQPQGAPDQRSASQSASAPATQEPQAQDGLTREAAERTVQEFYASAVRGDYEKAYGMLTDEWRARYFPTQAKLEGTFAPVEEVTFVEGPTGEVTGDTATVNGNTRAVLTTRIEENEGTWRLVDEGGEWRIDEWSVTNIETQPR